MITETQSTFKRDGSYANQFDEFGTLVIIDSTEKYLSVTLTREVYESPKVEIKKDIDNNLSIDEKIKWIEELKFEDFELSEYKYHPTIKAIMK